MNKNQITAEKYNHLIALLKDAQDSRDEYVQMLHDRNVRFSESKRTEWEQADSRFKTALFDLSIDEHGLRIRE